MYCKYLDGFSFIVRRHLNLPVAIPTEPNGGNHTPAFAKAAKSKEAHAATMISTRALARTALRFLENDQLFGEVRL